MQGDGDSGPAHEPDMEKLRRFWVAASPFWRMELPPDDDTATLVDCASVKDFEDS